LTFASKSQAKKEEDHMTSPERKRFKAIIDLEKLNTLNAEGCPACGRKFELGEPVVLACGAWEGEPKYIHENEAVFDEISAIYFERRCFESRKG
jgi:hypothetical protein